MRTTTVLAAILLLAAQAARGQSTDALRAAAATITPREYAWRVGVIAHDSMQGRNTPSPGLDRTAVWIASELERFGLRGGADDGSFIQRYPLEETALDTASSALEVGDGMRLAFGTDLLPILGATASRVEGELVVVSGRVDAEALARTDLDGRIVVIRAAPDAAAGRRALYGMLGALRTAGAAAVLLDDGSDDAAWAASVEGALEPRVGLPSSSSSSSSAGGRGRGSFPPLARIRTAALARLLAGSGVSLDALPPTGALAVTEVPTGEATLTLSVRTGEASAPNVVGILEGSDPALRDQYVVFSAHMDHVGMGTPDERGDSIFNGADDDASGTAGVLEIAEAVASLPTPPRRSTIFLLVSGEEKGLWGSAYYAAHPSVPVEQLVADLNMDMIGRNWPDTIVAIGKEHSDLGATLNRVNLEHPELGMTAIDDIWPEQNFYQRSDHYNFARRGVPILFFFNGTHPDYHGRDDEPDRIDADKASRISKLVFYLGMDVANRDEPPRWNPESYRRIVSEEGR